MKTQILCILFTIWYVLFSLRLLAINQDPVAKLPVQSITDYRVEPSLKQMEYLTGETTQIFAANTFWELSAAIDLPFTFAYMGQSFSQIKVSSNGFVTFDVSTSYHYTTNDLSALSPKNAVAPLWDWLKVSSSGQVHFQTVGTAPNRVFIVEFYKMIWGITSPIVDFQICLFESSNDIEFHYGSMADAGFGANGASIGIKDDQGNFINALDGSRDIPQNEILNAPRMNFRFTTSPPPPNDIGISAVVLNPASFVNMEETIQLIIENFGSAAQSGFSVACQIGPGAPIRETCDITVNPGSKEMFTFDQLWQPETSGLFSVKAWTELVGDANALNDTLFEEEVVTVYELEFPAPINLQGITNESNFNVLSWEAGLFERPLPGEWNGTTNENLDVHMILNFNSTDVDSCEIYYMVQGDEFPFPLQTYSRIKITNNQFSFYYNDQYGRMSVDVDGTFYPPDSCAGAWASGVYVNNVYTVFSGTWNAKPVFEAPTLLGYQVFRSDNSDVQPIAENLIEEIMDPFINTFTDNQAAVGVPYYYTVVANYDKGVSQAAPEVMVGASDIESNLTGLPQRYQLYAPYPNPFNPYTNIHFDLPLAGNVNLTVYGILGKKIATLVNERRPAGRYRVTFEADHLASGIYFVALESGKFQAVKRIALVK